MVIWWDEVAARVKDVIESLDVVVVISVDDFFFAIRYVSAVGKLL